MTVDRLRRHWVLVLVITVAAAAAISGFDSSYNRLQTAQNAAAFQLALGNHTRALAATASDIVFAAGYATLGIIAIRVLEPRRPFARAAAVLVVASALFDELENLTLIRNVVAERTITDGWITVMRVPGTLKWIGSPVFLLLLGGVARRLIRQRRSSNSAGR